MRSARGTSALVCLFCACSFPAPPTLLPPPFGPDPAHPEGARFFFPSGIAIDPDSRYLLVANSNSDRQYDAGAIYALRPQEMLSHFVPELPPGAPGEARQLGF